MFTQRSAHNSEKARPDAVSSSCATLIRGALWTSRGRHGRLSIRCRSGSLWVTVGGDSEDHLLHAGESFSARASRLIVAEALEDSEICLN